MPFDTTVSCSPASFVKLGHMYTFVITEFSNSIIILYSDKGQVDNRISPWIWWDPQYNALSGVSRQLFNWVQVIESNRTGGCIKLAEVYYSMHDIV